MHSFPRVGFFSGFWERRIGCPDFLGSVNLGCQCAAARIFFLKYRSMRSFDFTLENGVSFKGSPISQLSCSTWRRAFDGRFDQ